MVLTKAMFLQIEDSDKRFKTVYNIYYCFLNIFSEDNRFHLIFI